MDNLEPVWIKREVEGSEVELVKNRLIFDISVQSESIKENNSVKEK